MRVVRKLSIVLASIGVVAALLAVTAVALNPGMLGVRSPDAPATTQTQIDVPTWSVGDAWSYDVNLTRVEGDAQDILCDAHDDICDITSEPSDDLVARALVLGSLTASVAGIETTESGDVYNVSVTGSFELQPWEDRMPWERLDHEVVPIHFGAVTIEGYSLYLVDSLALVKDVRTVHMTGEFSGDWGTATAALTLWTVKTYDPAIDLWAFPILPMESWVVESTASVDVTSVFRLDAPDYYVEVGRHRAFDVPIRLVAESGEFEEVTTPAGTFQAIPISFSPSMVAEREEMDAVGVATALDHGELRSEATFEVWFSSDVGAAVRLHAAVHGLDLEIVLVEYVNA